MPKKHTASLTRSPQTPTKKDDSRILSDSSPSGRRSPSSSQYYRNSPLGLGNNNTRSTETSPNQRRTPPPPSPNQRPSPLRDQGQRKPPPPQSPRQHSASSEVDGRSPMRSNQSPGRGRGGGRLPPRGGSGGEGHRSNRMLTSNPSWLERRQAPPRDFSFSDFNDSMHVVHNQFGDRDNSISNHASRNSLLLNNSNNNSLRRDASVRASKTMFFGHESMSDVPDLVGLDNDIKETSSEKRKNIESKSKEENNEVSKKELEQQRFVLELGKLGIAQTIEYDSEDEMKKPQSDITIGDESYILDLARQKEKRKKDLQEEALEDALVVYKKELKEGKPENDERFLSHVVVQQDKLQKHYKKIWKEQDIRLANALQAELDRRTKESTLTLEVDDEDNNEIALPDARGNKGQRISAFIAKEKGGGVGNNSNSDIGGIADRVRDEEDPKEEGKKQDEERSEDADAKDDNENDKDNHAKKSKGKAEQNDEPVVDEESEKVSDRSLVTIDLVENRENGKGNGSKSTNETTTSPYKSSNDVLAHSNDDGDLIAIEEGDSVGRNKKTSTANNGTSVITAERKKKFTRCVLVGICLFFVFDAVLLVLLFLRD